jgi:hypothetical protein
MSDAGYRKYIQKRLDKVYKAHLKDPGGRGPPDILIMFDDAIRRFNRTKKDCYKKLIFIATKMILDDLKSGKWASSEVRSMISVIMAFHRFPFMVHEVDEIVDIFTVSAISCGILTTEQSYDWVAAAKNKNKKALS